MKVAVVQYNAGNIRSVAFALERLGLQPHITSVPEEIMQADKVIFPGVGEAKTTMAYLRDHKLDQVITGLKQPVLGICLGMQLLCRHSEENDAQCMGIFPTDVKKFTPANREKVPHMGWNALGNSKQWSGGVFDDQYVYFVHSYYVPVGTYTLATSHYIHDFSASIKKDNFMATQFHPEKSGAVGEQILKAFLTMP